MPRSHGAKVLLVQRDDGVDVEPLGQRDNRRVGPAEGKVAVLLDQVGNSKPVIWRRRFDVHSTRHFASTSAPSRVPIRYVTSATTMVGTIKRLPIASTADRHR
jgi:hypothetical protein